MRWQGSASRTPHTQVGWTWSRPFDQSVPPSYRLSTTETTRFRQSLQWRGHDHVSRTTALSEYHDLQASTAQSHHRGRRVLRHVGCPSHRAPPIAPTRFGLDVRPTIRLNRRLRATTTPAVAVISSSCRSCTGRRRPMRGTWDELRLRHAGADSLDGPGVVPGETWSPPHPPTSRPHSPT